MKNKIPPPVLLLLAGIVMWAVAHSNVAAPIDIPYARVVAALFAALGVFIVVLAMRRFRSADTTVNPLKPDEASSLVSAGIYGKTRNPMYLALLLVLMGWAVWLGSLTNVLVLVLFVPVITELQIKPEEEALRKLFGDSYEVYCRRVRRWI